MQIQFYEVYMDVTPSLPQSVMLTNDLCSLDLQVETGDQMLKIFHSVQKIETPKAFQQILVIILVST